jgi:hypothetical protein
VKEQPPLAAMQLEPFKILILSAGSVPSKMAT